MRTLANAQYQLKVMEDAHKEGCTCSYTEKDFDNFIAGKWSHSKGCPRPVYENLPNIRLLTEAMRNV